MNMDKEIFVLMEDEALVEKMASEITNAFVEKADGDNVDYSFTIGRRDGKITDEERANTYFYFDTDDYPNLDKFKKAFFAEDLETIEEGSIEEQELMEAARDFIIKVCQKVTEDHFEELKETVRRVVLGNKVGEDQVPLNTIDVISFDLADYSSVPESGKYLLKIGKVPDTAVDTEKVLRFVQDRQEETGETLQEIVDLERQAGNTLFNNVIAIQRGRKFLHDISIYLFVDYSLAEEVQSVTDIKEGLDEENTEDSPLTKKE